MRTSRRFRSLLYLALFLAESAASQPDPTSHTGVQDGAPVVFEDLEEVENALGTLDAAGVPPTREELARFLGEERVGRTAADGVGNPRLFWGSLQYRWGYYRNEGLDHYGKVSLEIPWLRLRARVREYRTGVREATGTVELGSGPVKLRAGVLGLSQGHGLLIGLPGRGSTLAADSGFGPRTERMVTWLGSDEPRALAGVGGTACLGPWVIRVIREEFRNPDVARSRRHTVAQLGFRRKDWRVSVAGQTAGGAGGISISAGATKGPFVGSLEAMGRISAPGIPPSGAAVIQVKWSPVRGSGLEGQFGFADLPTAPKLASRPAVLPGWAGRGFAVRGFTRTKSGLTLRALLHLGRHLDRKGTRSRDTRMLVDLQASQKLVSKVQASIRYRRDSRRAWEWSVRYPWQVPRPADPARRTIISMQLVYEQNKRRGRLMIRSYALENGSNNGRRSLVGLSGSQSVGRRWKIRGTWVNAWGDPVDLVSAVSPVSGMVLPRHWGRWRSETVLGLEGVGGGLRLQTAVSLRYPEKGMPGGPVPTIWVQARLGW